MRDAQILADRRRIADDDDAVAVPASSGSTWMIEGRTGCRRPAWRPVLRPRFGRAAGRRRCRFRRRRHRGRRDCGTACRARRSAPATATTAERAKRQPERPSRARIGPTAAPAGWQSGRAGVRCSLAACVKARPLPVWSILRSNCRNLSVPAATHHLIVPGSGLPACLPARETLTGCSGRPCPDSAGRPGRSSRRAAGRAQ